MSSTHRHSPPNPSHLARHSTGDDESNESQYAEFTPAQLPNHTPRSPNMQQRQYSGMPTPNPLEDSRLLSSPMGATGFAQQQQQSSQEYIDTHRVGRSVSAGSFAPATASPLAHASSTTSMPRSASNSRPASRGSFRNVSASAGPSSEGVITTLGLGAGPHTSAFPASLGSHGSMVLYRLAPVTPPSRSASSGSDPLLLPPRMFSKRNSVASSSGDSIMSLADSKYPSGPGGAGDKGLGIGGGVRGLVPYAYDPAQDDGELDEEDWLHDPNAGLTDPQTRSPRYGPTGAPIVSTPKKKQQRMGPDGKPYHGSRSFPMAWSGQHWRAGVACSRTAELVYALSSIQILP